MTTVAERKHSQRKVWQAEWPFEVELLPLHKLFAEEYQRPVIDPFVTQKVKEFDPTLVGTLDVSSDAESSRYAILDGLQRSEIVARVGKKAVWCSVYHGMTFEERSAFFLKKNRERRNMHPFYALRARRLAGEGAAGAIFAIAKRTGFVLAATSSTQDGIVAVGAVEDAYGMRSLVREEALTPTLKTVRNSFPGRAGATEGTLLRGLGRFWQAYADDEVNVDRLYETLAAAGPKTLVGYATDRVQTSRHPKAFLTAQEIVRIYNKGLKREAKLNEQFLSASYRSKYGR